MSIGETVLELLRIAEPTINKVLRFFGLPENFGLSEAAVNTLEKLIDKIAVVLFVICLILFAFLSFQH